MCALSFSGGRWLSVIDGSKVVAALTGVLDETSIFYLQPIATNVFNLRSAKGISIAVDSQGVLIADINERESANAAFELQAYEKGKSHVLRSVSTGLYVSVDGSGRAAACAAKPDFFCEAHVTFNPLLGMVPLQWVLLHMDGKKVAITTKAALRWWTAAPPTLLGGGEITTQTEKLVNWEQFTLSVVDSATSTVALQSDHGRWVMPHPDSGSVHATAKAIGNWERLTLMDAGDGAVAFRTAHARYPYLSAHTAVLDARANTVSESERFYLFDATSACKRFWDSNPGIGGGMPVLAVPVPLTAVPVQLPSGSLLSSLPTSSATASASVADV